MPSAVRHPLTAGAAFLGAGAIAASTLVAVPDMPVTSLHPPAAYSAAVNLLASGDALAAYQGLFQGVTANIGTLVDNADPGALLRQFLLNQLDSLATLAGGLGDTASGIAGAVFTEVPQLVQTAINQLAAGQISDAVGSLIKVPLAVVLPVGELLPALQEVLTKPLRNLANIIDSFTVDPLATTLLLSGFIAPLISTPGAIAAAVQDVFDAFGKSPAAVLDALIKAPATIIDGFLNGGYGPDLGPLVQPGVTVKAGGLLSSPGLVLQPDGTLLLTTGGPLSTLQQLIKQITAAITPTAPTPAAAAVSTAAVTTVPDGAQTVTLTTGDTPAPATGPATESAPGPAESDDAQGAAEGSAPVGSEVADGPTGSPAQTPVSADDEAAAEETEAADETDVDDTDAAETDADATETDAGEQESADNDGDQGPTGHDSTAGSSAGSSAGAHASSPADSGSDSASTKSDAGASKTDTAA